MVQSVPEHWEEISNFFGAYLNQDFPDDYGTPDHVIRAFKEEAPQDVLVQVARQAEDLGRSTRDEQELRALMLDLGIEYAPWADGWTSHAWLEHLAVALRT